VIAMTEKKESHHIHHHTQGIHHPAHDVHKKKSNLIFVLTIVLGLLMVINLFYTYTINKEIKLKTAELKEEAKPADLQLISIIDPSCKDCFDLSPVIETIKGYNINISKEYLLNLDDDRAKKIIEDYGIEKIPTILLSGEINKSKPLFAKWNELGIVKNNAMILTNINPPYTDAKTSKIIGHVTVTQLIESSCKKCTDLEPIIEQIKLIGVSIANSKKVETKSDEGKKLIAKYEIKKIPSLIFSGDLSVYDQIVQSWTKIGVVAPDGSYILKEINPPYLNLSDNKLKGIVDLTNIVDKSCDKCYNTSQHQAILKRYGMAIENIKNLDISTKEGKDLINKYNITLVPTIILSKDAKEYASFISVWRQVGTVENDGTYIFRNLKAMGAPYKDLSTGTVLGVSTKNSSEE